MKKLIILASGSGTNAENIIRHFEPDSAIDVSCVLTNNPSAGVLERCNHLKVPAFYFNKSAFSSGAVSNCIKCLNPDLLVLAGFLWKIPKDWIKSFPNKIVNLHPALLPKYGGKGMYGNHVHQAVKESGEDITGITIHYVNEHYDEGAIIFQEHVSILSTDDTDAIANKVHALEYEHYPKVIKNLLMDG